MATIVKLDMAHGNGFHQALGATIPEIVRTDNKIFKLNGHSAEIFVVTTGGAPESNVEIPTSLDSVDAGMLFNPALAYGSRWLANAVQPKTGGNNQSIAVVTGSALAASTTFIVVVVGAASL